MPGIDLQQPVASPNLNQGSCRDQEPLPKRVTGLPRRSKGLVNAANLDHQFILACKLVEQSGLPNFAGCQIPIPTHLNLDEWEYLLQNYEKNWLVSRLRYGWPIGYEGELDTSHCSQIENHKGATEFPEEISSYVQREVSAGNTLGPFKTSPFEQQVMLSALSSVPKRNSTDRRIISDLSYPEGKSVNDGIPKKMYMGQPTDLEYPSVDGLAKIIHKKGRDCLIFKLDILRCFRQWPVCPGDVRKLGFKWQDNIYLDRVVSMGLRTGPYICQTITEAILYVFQNMGFDAVVFVDDFAGGDVAERVHQAFLALRQLLKRLGVEEAEAKAVLPTIVLIFLGVWFNTHRMTMEVEKERLEEITLELADWEARVSCTKKQLQSLVGLLNFVSKCVRPARPFMARMFNFLQEIPKKGVHQIPAEVKMDVKWWQEYFPRFNGVTLIPPPDVFPVNSTLATDSCLTGCGGFNFGTGGKFPLHVSR